MSANNQIKTIDRRVRWTITVIALALVLARVLDASIFERLDIIGIGLLVIAALPWASSFLSEISIAGVMEAKFRALEEKIEETKAQADSATRRAIASEDLVIMTPTGQEGLPGAGIEVLEALAKRYVEVRKSMRRGDERTSAMTAIFRDMSTAARNLKGEEEQARRWLLESDAGKVLAGIAYAYVHSSGADVTSLISATTTTKQPFVQYWALRVILEIVRSTGLTALSQKDIADLRAMESQVAKGTDRAYLIASINKSLNQQLQ